jgi:hypothetical protein
MICVYGFMAITDHAARAEKRLRGGEAVSAVAADITALVDTIRRIEGYQLANERLAA